MSLNFNDVMGKHISTAFFDYDRERERQFINLKNLMEAKGDITHKIEAIFINTKSKFGDAPVIYTDDYMVNIPEHMLETCQEIRQDEDAVDLINEGRVGFQVYSYNGKNGTGYSINIVEIK